MKSLIGFQETGKAVFPGEKKLMDDSPDIDENDSFYGEDEINSYYDEY